MVRNGSILATFVLLTLAGCKKEESAVVPDPGYDYFPRVVGHWVEYQVDSIWRDDPSAVHDSVSYRLREKVVDQYIDGTGRTCYLIHRSVKDETGNWVVRDVWTSTRGTTNAQVTEENVRMMKLAFPVKNTISWDLNVFNTDEELKVVFREKESPWSRGGLSFGNTVLVKNAVPPNFVETRNYEERYAAGVGMITRYQQETTRQAGGTSGWWLYMVAVAHGTE